jgi:hypothetical protein
MPEKPNREDRKGNLFEVFAVFVVPYSKFEILFTEIP